MLIREIFEGDKKTKHGKEVLKKSPFSPEKYMVIEPEPKSEPEPEPETEYESLDELLRFMDYNYRRKHFMQPNGHVPEPEELVRRMPPLA
jgi:hypothetical protein